MLSTWAGCMYAECATGTAVLHSSIKAVIGWLVWGVWTEEGRTSNSQCAEERSCHKRSTV